MRNMSAYDWSKFKNPNHWLTLIYDGLMLAFKLYVQGILGNLSVFHKKQVDLCRSK